MVSRLVEPGSQPEPEDSPTQKSRIGLTINLIRDCPDGRSRTRTCDIYDVNVALYQLSYATSETAEVRAKSPNLSRDTPTGTRTPVSAVRGRYPRPLDDRGMQNPPFREGQNSKRGTGVAQPLSTFLETDVSWEMQTQAIVVIDPVSSAVMTRPIRRS